MTVKSPPAAKAVPVPTPTTKPFWEGTAAGELRVQQCDGCHKHFLYPRVRCPFCGSDKTTWVATSGRGRLFSYVINHMPAPGWEGEVPYVIAVVQLDEGPRMMSNLIGVPADPPRWNWTCRWRSLSRPRQHDAAAVQAGGQRRRAMSRMKIAIAGAAETDLGALPHMSELDLRADAAHRALADAGLTLADVDGITSAVESPIDVAHYLGITPTWYDGTSVGGCSFLVHVRHAAAAIRAGLCSTVLVLHGESGRSRVGSIPRQRPAYGMLGQFELPYGAFAPPNMFTLPVMRYLKDTGTTHEQLAEVVVAQSHWVAGNPRASRNKLLTVQGRDGARR
jgi:uncharacterized OB-fold protein